MPEQLIKVKQQPHQHQSSGSVFCDVKKADGGQPDFYGSSSNISNSNGDICRICHCEADPGNPLLSPCYCAGSLKYVHQTCLQQWLAASDTRSCELCKFNFILHTKIKPIGEWRRLEMSSIERRRLLCAILFHFVAAVCVVWSLFVLIDRAAEEVHKGIIAWPFWTKLVVVAVGFTGGAVFMYIQCRQYLHLFSRWKAHNRIILVQNAPEKVLPSQQPMHTAILMSPSIIGGEVSGGDCSRRANTVSSQVVASVEMNPPPGPPHQHSSSSSNPVEACYVFAPVAHAEQRPPELSAPPHRLDRATGGGSLGSCDALELNIREILALDVEYSKRCSQSSRHARSAHSRGPVFKSLPNLSASSENLLV